MDFITFLQNINSNILSSIAIFFNLVLFVRLIVGCGRGIRQGWTVGEATTGKITELGLYTAILFGAWQWWPQEWVWFTVLPQCAFVVFAGGLIGCTSKWGVERAFLRS
ncbi:hypothetical protein QUA41_17415 [Microcoleus sp. Pol11C1]|uniref:hypothetical protein n=1 Tax=unclassified Microcoleus TaxID=2642155 RepID=UPI002FCFD4C7